MNFSKLLEIIVLGTHRSAHNTFAFPEQWLHSSLFSLPDLLIVPCLDRNFATLSNGLITACSKHSRLRNGILQ
jgi:hypothetical protein